MGAKTDIAWTDHTFNPWWGCSRVSPGCEHCYAEAFSHRLGRSLWGKKAERRFFGPNHWAEPLSWNLTAETNGRRERVFCASMADVFEDRRDLDQWREELWGLIEITPNLDWQLLTKRPENVARLAPEEWMAKGWPWPRNAWLGVTVEDQQRADERVPVLLGLPAPIKFLSCEPLLGPVALLPWLTPYAHTGALAGVPGYEMPPSFVKWVIVGGESGAGHRPMLAEWAFQLVGDCVEAEVPVFVKQAGGARPGLRGELPDWLWNRKEFPR